MSDLHIREADQDHAPQIAEIHVRSFLATYEHLPLTRRSTEDGRDGRAVFWKERLGRPKTRTLVAVEDDRVVGFIHLGPSPDDDADETTGHVFSVHVEPAHTGSGAGGQLIESAVSVLAADGYNAATLWAVRENSRAQRFYSRHGWRSDGVVRTERLSVGEEEGDEVEVVRFRLDLVSISGGSNELSF